MDEKQYQVLKKLSATLPDVILNERQICDFELLVTGVFAPLTGFMTRVDYESVLDRMRLSAGALWPVPICLDIHDTLAGTLEAGQSVVLRDPEGFLLGNMTLEDIWPVDREAEALAVYGTLDCTHPGVDYLFNRSGTFYIGGPIQALNLPIHPDFRQIRLTPAEVRVRFDKLGWQRIVGFQTRQPIHRLQFELTIQAMQKARANLLLLPAAGFPGLEDFDHYTRMRCYQKVGTHYPPDSYMLNLIPLAPRMAGPREAVLHLIIGKNFGCTHFVIGHNHGSPAGDTNGTPFYPPDQAETLAAEAAAELGIEPVFFEELDRSYPSPARQGVTIFFTGLSGAGKSTIAKVLYARFLEMGTRPVSLLDGDIVRRNLSSELNFSKEHRDINVRRIGFVASEITKNRGIAICPPIAPYQRTRDEIRKSIKSYGGFFEIHVSTPITECEKRDRKGMYAKARAGLLKGFTGVDDPYEPPHHPELRIDTTAITPEEAAREVLLLLSRRKFV